MSLHVFLDRDGTIIKDTHFLKDPADIRFETDVIVALKQFVAQGATLFIITNQSGIARGLITPQQFLATMSHLLSLLEQDDIHISDYFYCPHHPTEGYGDYKQDCLCRKPKPGMLLKALERYHIDPKQSVMIGDKLIDVDAGQRANMTGILVKTGYGEQELSQPNPRVVPDFVANTLLEAADYALQL